MIEKREPRRGRATVSQDQNRHQWPDRLNGLLMRMVLRPLGSPEHLDAEGELYRAVWPACSRVAGGKHDDAEELRGELLLLWRSGRLTGFTKQYLIWKLDDLRRRRRRTAALDDQARGDGAVGPETGAMARDIVEAVRGSLRVEDQRLFDAWLTSGGQNGWQRDYARATGASEPAVSKRVNQIRDCLHERHGVHCPDEFMRLVPGCLACDVVGLPPSAEGACQHEPVEDAGPAALSDRVARVRESFEPGERDRQLLDALWNGAPNEEITAAFPDEAELLRRAHKRYYEIARREREEGDVAEREG